MIENVLGRVKKKKGILLLIFGIVLGLILVIGGGDEKTKSTLSNDYTAHINEYTEKTEIKLENLIDNIEGASDVNVMITLESGSEFVYASDDSEKEMKHVIVNGELVYTKEYLPKIKGVAVVCKGGDRIEVKSKVTELVCSVLGMYSTRVYVTE